MLKTRFLKLEALRRDHCRFFSLEFCVFEKHVFYSKGKATIIFVHAAFPTPFSEIRTNDQCVRYGGLKIFEKQDAYLVHTSWCCSIVHPVALEFCGRFLLSIEQSVCAVDTINSPSNDTSTRRLRSFIVSIRKFLI